MSFDYSQLLSLAPVAGDLITALVKGIEDAVAAGKAGDPAAALAGLEQAIADVQPIFDALPKATADADAAAQAYEDAKFPPASPLAPAAAAVAARARQVAAAFSATAAAPKP